jgi:pectate lyase
MSFERLTLCCILATGCPSDDPGGDAGSSGDASTHVGSTSAEPTTSTAATSAASTSSASDSTTGTSDDASTSGSASTGATMPPQEYEGYGAVTMGAHSCERAPDVVHVTTLADSGPGSLREAVSAGCREIVFDVGGTIALESDLNVPHAYITIDGSSAPEPGITIVQSGTLGTTIEASGSLGPAHDIIIHHLRMDGMSRTHENEGDIWGLDGEAAEVYNVIIDHVTATASADGVFDIWENVHDVTISWNFITDTVTALHLSTGTSAARERISFHHNVFAGNNERQIRIRHANDDIDYRNNVVYGWGWFEGGAAGLHIAYDPGEINPSMNVVGNVFHFVSGLDGDEDDAILFERGPDEGNVYFADNIVPPGENDDVSTGAELAVPPSARVTLYEPGTLAQTVVPWTGTHYPTEDESARLQQIASEL